MSFKYLPPKKIIQGVYGSLIILLITSLLSLTGLLNSPNYFFYDLFSSISSESIEEKQKSLVITCTQIQADTIGNGWKQIIETLEKFQALQIIFTFFPDNLEPAYLKELSQNPKIFISTQHQISGIEPDISTGLDKTNTLIGIQYLAAPEKGVHREHYSDVLVNGQLYPHAVKSAVEDRLKEKLQIDQIFWINFNGKSPGAQPTVTLKQAQDGYLVSSLVKDRAVVIGLALDHMTPGLITPVSNRNVSISFPVFTAYAYDTLLTGKTTKPVSVYLVCLLLLCIVLVNASLFKLLPSSKIIITALFGFVSTLFLSWALLSMFLIWLPPSEFLILQLFLLVQLITLKLNSREKRIETLLLKFNREVQERLSSDSLLDSKKYWNQITHMVNQTLHINRSIFLETVSGDHRVREVAALNCSLDDIQEKRRDYKRTPYSTALQRGKITEVQNYLSHLRQSKELQFLYPLLSPEKKTLGFWAFGIEPEKISDQDLFLQECSYFGLQIAEILHRRKIFNEEQKKQKNKFQQILTLQGGEKNFEKITSLSGLLTRRLKLLEKILNTLETATVLYDIFGKIALVNTNMSKICQSHGISLHTMSASSLLSSFAEIDIVEAKQIISDLILYQKETVLYSKSFGRKNSTYLIAIKPILKPEDPEEIEFEEKINTFQVKNILFEFHEMTDIKKVLEMKERIFDLSSQDFKQYELSFQAPLKALKEPGQDPNTKRKSIEFIDKKLQSLFDYLKRLTSLMNKNILTGEISSFPTHSEGCLQDAIERLDKNLAEKKLKVEFSLPDYITPVLAMPVALETVFYDLLAYLVKDATPQTPIVVFLHREHKNVIFELSNAGYGMPNQDFQNYIIDTDSSGSQEMSGIKQAIHNVQSFDGELKAMSELGQGTKFTLKLKRFR